MNYDAHMDCEYEKFLELLSLNIMETEIESDVDYRESTLPLRRVGIRFVGDLIAIERVYLEQVPGLSAEAISTIDDFVERNGLSFNTLCKQWLARKRTSIQDEIHVKDQETLMGRQEETDQRSLHADRSRNSDLSL